MSSQYYVDVLKGEYFEAKEGEWYEAKEAYQSSPHESESKEESNQEQDLSQESENEGVQADCQKPVEGTFMKTGKWRKEEH